MDIRLKGEKRIQRLFREGKHEFMYPVKMVYQYVPSFVDADNFQFGVSVSKRHFKKAVDRNYIKRLLREAIRLQQTSFIIVEGFRLEIMFIYAVSNPPEFHLIKNAVRRLTSKVKRGVGQQEGSD